MPRYKPSDEEMDSMYSSKPAVTPPGAAGAPPEKSASEKPSVDEENAAESTAIISNKILSPEGEPIKEGDEIVLQVVKNYGDESEVKYAPHKSGEEEGEGEGEGASEPSTDNLSAEGKDFAAMDKGTY